MPIDVRRIEPDELRPALKVMGVVFGDAMTEELYEDEELIAEVDRYDAAFSGGDIVGTAAAYTFDVTLPGGSQAPMAGVTNVGVVPTHRRQGVLRAMMARQLDDIAERGEALAGLTASESGIYRRFGYGVATWRRSVRLVSAHSAFLRPTAIGGLRQIDDIEAAKVLPAIWDDHLPTRAGTIARTPAYWELQARDRTTWREGASERRIVVHEGAGGPDGYVVHRVKSEWNGGLPAGEVQILELIAVDPEVEAALWRYCLDVDLTASAIAWHLPPDWPLLHRMTEPRQVQTVRDRDHLWVRILDVPTALASRRYETAGEIVLGVVDGFRPETTGSYRLEVGPDGASAERTTADPEVTLDIADLGGAYLGGSTIRDLHRAGLVEEHRAGAVQQASQIFATAAAPWCPTEF